MASTGVKVAAWVIGGLLTVSVASAVFGGGGDDGLDTARVVRVIDGDTIDVNRDGEEIRVRLLNIDTPETKNPDLPVQCLGPEASDYLTALLPPGTSIELDYDVQREDQYDRTLAAVFLEGELVNAQIAAEGLGLPMLFEPNDRFYQDVVAASESAQRQGVGLFADDIACTLESQVATAMDSADAASAELAVADAAAVAVATSVVSDLDLFAANLTPDGVAVLGNEEFTSRAAEDYLAEHRGRIEQVSEDLDRERIDAETELAEHAQPEAHVSEPEPDSGSSSCVPYGPEIPYSNDGGYTGKRYGMPGGQTFRMCE